ncbi:pappalysin-1-like isoform X2 [Watersipora subatra]|uniref:pappalysin-1-like isoform X2 n=1 Tax=Watersipora subatra TaxID=2589382 RepID=UPI00355C80B9
MAYGRLSLQFFCLFIWLLQAALAYNCYKNTDKESKPLDLSTHSSSLSQASLKLRHKRDLNQPSPGALEFDIGNYLYISDIDHRVVEHDEFTISFWLYLEGGQPSGATILSLKNTCFKYSPWYFRLYPPSEDTDLKSQLTFTIEDVYRQKKSVFIENYAHHAWFQITLVNSVTHMKMYLNGVRISTAEGMAWKEFAGAECLQLELGRQKKIGFRGKLSRLLISYQALTARNVKQLNVEITIPREGVWFDDPLSALNHNWTSESPPLAVEELINQRTPQTVSAPVCGKTVCDDPSIVTAYASDPALKIAKTVALEFLVMANSDGTGRSVSADDINKAQQYITRVFQSHSINWDFSTKVVKNSTLRNSFMMLDCWPDMIGDGKCNSNCGRTECCNFPITNYDGGDCPGVQGVCTDERYYNNVCDQECNTDQDSFDNGACCQSVNERCIDYSHENRSYFHLTEVKNSIPTSEDKLSIIVLNWMDLDMLGVASLPWERNSDHVFGSLVVNPAAIAAPFSYETLVHELGHVLGLWHVHHGITEVKDCSDECLEREASLVLGDLCSDTTPTYRHIYCADPVIDSDSDICFIEAARKNTPFSNFMSYANGSCSDDKTFTLQQSARMHCYLDLVHSRTFADRRPSAVPLPPQVLYADTGSVTLSWLPPLAAGHEREICQHCSQQGSLTQYASSATLTDADKYVVEIKEEYGPEHATRAPDSASCKLTEKVWSPVHYYWSFYRCVKTNPQFNFMFDEAVRPESIRMWIPWYYTCRGKDSPIQNIQLVSPDGQVVKEISEVHIQCDKPFTKAFKSIQTKVNKIVVNAFTPDLAFDAVELKSAPQTEACTECHSLVYKVEREPSTSEPVIVSDTLYEDKTVEANVQYSYKITAIIGDVIGMSSSPFIYVHNQKFCGNGQADEAEECDDGNFAGGDGCSSDCKVERGYVCLGTPSICWLDVDMENRHCSFKFTHEEDGCGYYVPTGYRDQWASSVATIGDDLTCTPEHLLLGPPPPGLKCQSELTDLSPPLWLPCQMMRNEYASERYQIKLGFEKPVVATAVLIHIATGSRERYADTTILVSHIFEDGEIDTIRDIYEVDCTRNPLTESIIHNLSMPFKRTKEVMLKVQGRTISIAAVRLRTYATFDPVTVDSCGDSLYDSVSNQCVRPTATSRPCEPLDLPNSNVTCTGYGDGDTCIAFCDLGYETNTVSGSTTCIGGHWEPPLSCDMITCQRPNVPLGYAVCSGGHHYDSVCEIACNSPSQLRGNGTLIKCIESATWTEPRASCAPICSDLTTHSSQLTDDSCSGSQEIGSRCRLECLPGYHIRGYDQKTRRDKTVCLRTGKWDKECVRIECEKIPAVWTGLYTCTDGLNSGTVCTATCPATQVSSVMSCLPTGRWNSSFAACETDNHCPGITGTREDVKFNCTGTTAGSVCRVSCLNNSLTEYQQKDGVFSVFRDKLHCTYSGSWSADIDSISCHPLCQPEYMGDGWCDAVNNRQVCHWDEGDCCSSTSKASVVQAYPESCSSECSCRDPEAQSVAGIGANRWLIERDGYAVDRLPSN